MVRSCANAPRLRSGTELFVSNEDLGSARSKSVVTERSRVTVTERSRGAFNSRNTRCPSGVEGRYIDDGEGLEAPDRSRVRSNLKPALDCSEYERVIRFTHTEVGRLQGAELTETVFNTFIHAAFEIKSAAFILEEIQRFIDDAGGGTGRGIFRCYG